MVRGGKDRTQRAIIPYAAVSYVFERTAIVANETRKGDAKCMRSSAITGGKIAVDIKLLTAIRLTSYQIRCCEMNRYELLK